VGVFCGIDWAEPTMTSPWSTPRAGCWHAGASVTTRAGDQQLLQLLAEAGDSATEPIPVAIQTSRGLLVPACEPPAGAWPPSPLAVSRYRDRHGVAGAKSDHRDAVVLAGILRPDQAAHRPCQPTCELVQAIAVLARASRTRSANRQQLAMKLRSLLREFFPAALAAFQHKHVGLTAPQAPMVPAAAPTPTQAASLTTTQLRSLRRHAGRQRSLDAWTTRLQASFHADQPRQLPRVEQAVASRAWPCSPNWRRPARPPTSWPRPPSSSSAATRPPEHRLPRPGRADRRPRAPRARR
jgi:hypothetical protein